MINKYELNANERTENMKETNSRKKQRGFTLAETLIALTILGIVAAITVPQLVRKHVERANRVKFKKAVMSYESVMNKIAIMNDLKSNGAIQSWATKDNTVSDCSVAYNYFKSVKDLSTDSKCKFKTADGVYWDITDIQKPIVALKENDLTDLVAQSDTNRAFYLYAQYDGTGILRVTEPNFNYNLVSADADNVNSSVDRLWAYLNGETSTSNEEVIALTPRQNFYKKYLNHSYEMCSYSHAECFVNSAPDTSKCNNCYVHDGEFDFYIEDGQLIAAVKDNSDGSVNMSLFTSYVPYQITTTFHENGMISSQTFTTSYVIVAPNGHKMSTNATITYNYDNNGNYLSCSSSTSNVNCSEKCNDYFYACGQ